jgi:phage antirepressor YoqD-like protein
MSSLALNTDFVKTMSSKQIADVVDKRHDNVKRTIETLAKQGVISQPQIEDGNKSANGVIEKLYMVNERDSYVVVAQLCPEFTAKLVDYWQATKNQQPVANIYDTLKDPTQMRGYLLHYVEQVIALEAKSQAMKVDVKALEQISKADGSLCITDAAKALQVNPKFLFSWLRENRWIYKRAGNSHDVGYQDKVQTGYLEHKVTEVTRGDGSTKITEQVRITPKGLTKLAKIFAQGEAA